jgi:hypothetical protein
MLALAKLATNVLRVRITRPPRDRPPNDDVNAAQRGWI